VMATGRAAGEGAFAYALHNNKSQVD
jgi:hypothetical protein